MLAVHRHADAKSFLTRAEAWLLRSEVAHAVLLGNARNASVDDSRYEKPTYWATIEDGDELVGCCYRTPPFKVGVTALPGAALAPLVDDLSTVYAQVSGFSGPEPTVTPLAEAWVARHGGRAAIVPNTRQQILAFGGLPPPSVPGVLRLASQKDAGLAQSWGGASSIDSGIAALDGQFCLQLLRAGRLYFFADDQPRCMLGLIYETPRAIAVGVVYTPATYRGRGYAAAAMGALDGLLREREVSQRYLCINPVSTAALALAAKLECSLVQEALDVDCA